MQIRDWSLPYATRLQARPASAIDLVVMHCTELPDLAMAREYGERIHYEQSRTGNSGHYYIDRDGTVLQFVPDTHIAHHVAGHNANSIGVELVNRGRYPHWLDSRHQTFEEPYDSTQINALLDLLALLRTRYPYLLHIAGHADLDQRVEPASDNPAVLLPRRLDPGPLFPWQQVISASGLQRLPPVPVAALRQI